MKRAGEWRCASVPKAYGFVDDGATCRHVRVSRNGLTLDGLKRAVLAAYEHQYAPHEIKLFTRVYDDNPKQLRERGVIKAISYDPDWADLDLSDTGDAGTVLLVVSPLDEAEAELLVLPVAHSPPHTVVQKHATPPAGTCVAAASSLAVVSALAKSESALFEPLPLPAHVDDWLAQYREAPQSISDLLGLTNRVSLSKARHAIYLQPLVLPRRSPQIEAAETRLFQGLHGFLCAFYTGIAVVRLAEVATLSIDKPQKRAHVLNSKPILWRDSVPSTGQAMPHGQLSAPHLLEALKPRPNRAKGVSTRIGGALPADGFCVLGVTMADLFCDDDDVFTGGLACLTSRAGLFSFHRYAEGGGDEGVMLLRACKTAAHEIAHMFGIGHCLYRHCLMNGCGHLKEDFAARHRRFCALSTWASLLSWPAADVISLLATRQCSPFVICGRRGLTLLRRGCDVRSRPRARHPQWLRPAPQRLRQTLRRHRIRQTLRRHQIRQTLCRN